MICWKLDMNPTGWTGMHLERMADTRDRLRRAILRAPFAWASGNGKAFACEPQRRALVERAAAAGAHEELQTGPTIAFVRLGHANSTIANAAPHSGQSPQRDTQNA